MQMHAVGQSFNTSRINFSGGMTNNYGMSSTQVIEDLRREIENLRRESEAKDAHITHLMNMLQYSNGQISNIKCKPVVDETVSEKITTYVTKTVFKKVKFAKLSTFLDLNRERDDKNNIKGLGMEIATYLSQYPKLGVPSLDRMDDLQKWWFPYR